MYEIQHLPINTHLQAMAGRGGWIQYVGGLSNDFFLTNIILAQTQAKRSAGDLRYTLTVTNR